MPPQAVEVVPKQATPKKIKRVPCTTYPVPPPSPDPYKGDFKEDFEDNDSDSPYHDMKAVKWYDNDEDSYGSRCPENKKYSCKRPPTIQLEKLFLRFFDKKHKGVPYWAMLEIRVDLQEEYGILC